jgi:hypothetical protein
MGFIILLLIVAGICKAWADALADEEMKELDWTNKYDFTKSGMSNHWWYFGLHKPSYPEKFPFSSTVLVFLTDRWHMSQFMMLRCFYLAIALSLTDSLFWILMIVFIIGPVVLGVSFQTVYTKLRSYYQNIKKEKK